MHSVTAGATSPGWNRSGKPLLIMLAPPVLVLLALSHGLLLFAVMTDNGAGTVSLGTSTVGSGALWSLVVPVFTLWIAVYLGAAYGLFRQRLWARPLLVFAPLGLYVLLSAGVLAYAESVVSAIAGIDWTGLIVIAAVYLYMYHYAPARKYYDRLRNEREE